VVPPSSQKKKKKKKKKKKTKKKKTKKKKKKGDRYVGLTILPNLCADLEILRASNVWIPGGLGRDG
jgi:hypothetical protein